ncbi:MAG: peptidoglycan DD-metalloendopeptidase family protein [Thermodesulfobacteriota bacterium]
MRPVSDVSSVADLLPLGNDGLPAYRGSEFVERHVTVRRGDTFASLLRLYDVGVREAHDWHRGTRKTFDLAKISPRRSLTLFFERDTGTLAAVEYRIDPMNVLVAERGADREIRARIARIPASTEFRAIAGTLQSNMAADCAAAGISQRIIAELADIFAWELDFEKLQRGDTFRVVYEVAIGRDGDVVQTGRILAAEIGTHGRVHNAILHTAEDGTQAYYDLEGRSLDRGQLRYPLEFTRITSGFSMSRLHPVLARHRPHYGVDFAAPQGTPVRAMADGVVTHAGWQGQLGRAVRIDHADPSAYESVYGHLSRVASSVRVGRKVRRGEIIGYVGRTGLATGPHLHLELNVDGKPVDPLGVLVARPPIDRQPGPAFDRKRLLLLTALEAVESGGPVRLTRLTAPFTLPQTQMQ